MPKVRQAHLDARRQQIIDAARARFASHGFARTSMADLVSESELSTGAIYRYFKSKDEIVVAVCEQASDLFPASLSPAALGDYLEKLRELARENGHARMVAQIYAEAAISPSLAAIVEAQLVGRRAAVAHLVRAQREGTPGTSATPEEIAEAFIAVCNGFAMQLAIRGDLDPAPFTRALLAVVE